MSCGEVWVRAETNHEALRQARSVASALEQSNKAPTCRIVEDPGEQGRLWELRESGLAATAHVTGQHPTWPGWEDSSVPVAQLGRYLRELRVLFQKFDYHPDLYGHFGQGCVHCRIDFDFRTDAGVATFRAFMHEAADLVVRHGGSLSGEHGDGQARGELLDRMFSAEMLRALRQFKAIWDPEWRMNPGKVIDARPLDADLRMKGGPPEAPPITWFRFPGDQSDFRRAARRCVGVGKCRKDDAGTMCPSYMVTREEKHSTRGRARMLFEMVQGDPLSGGWTNEHVKEALDLCLACKGCKNQCPVSVDMATYKAEFLAHYYEAHRRPRSAYAFGFISRWARLAELAPGLMNFTAHTPLLRTLTRSAAGMAGARDVPAFAASTFRSQFLRRTPLHGEAAPRVILWPDTFNDHFHPSTLMSAVQVLEATGFRVEIPRARLCCGRPLYDYGFLGAARMHLETIMHSLQGEIDAGAPIVVLEPSCAAVFHDELLNLFPDDQRAHRLSEQVVSLGGFLQTNAEHLPPMTLYRKALVHGHCHQKALTGLDPELSVLRRLGLDLEVPDSGCCGMAGSFGFERDHYDVSVAVGERVLVPSVRSASSDALIVSDGFSCREQIAQLTSRRALHLADVLALAMRTGPHGPPGDCPERSARGEEQAHIDGGTALLLTLGATAAGLLFARERRRRDAVSRPHRQSRASTRVARQKSEHAHSGGSSR